MSTALEFGLRIVRFCGALAVSGGKVGKLSFLSETLRFLAFGALEDEVANAD